MAAPTMDGSVTLRIPPGTRSGRTFRVRGGGVKGGDLLVTVEVAVPSTLTDEQRHLVEQLERTHRQYRCDLVPLRQRPRHLAGLSGPAGSAS